MSTQQDTTLDEGREVAIDASAISTIVKGEIDMQIATAHRFPRSVTVFRKEALGLVTLDQAVAEGCNYVLRRKQWDNDKREFVTVNIEGPSARFAEVICSTWGNVRWGSRVVGERNGFIVAQGMFHDLQRNSAGAIEVERSILTSKGDRFKQDMVGVTANAAGSIALRNAILKGIPRAFWNDIYLEARKVALGDFKTLTNRRIDALDACKKFGVSPEQVFALLEVRGVEDIGLEHLLTLRSILASIRDNEETVERAFPSEADAAAYLGKPGAIAGAMPKSKSETAPAAHEQVKQAADLNTLVGKAYGAIDERSEVAAKAAAAQATQNPTTGPADPFGDMRSDPPFDTREQTLFDKDEKPASSIKLPLPEAIKAGEFMATPAEIKSLMTRIRAKGFKVDELVSLLDVPERVKLEQEPDGSWVITAIPKDEHRLLKAQVS